MTLRRIDLATLARLALGLGGLVWRLDHEPVQLGFLAGRIEATLAAQGLAGVEVADAS